MALRGIWIDDFSGYTNQAGFYAAYPYDPPTDTSPSTTEYAPGVPYVAWGLTRGPGGVPGIENVTATEAPDPFGHGQHGLNVDKVNLAPECRIFRASGRWDFADFVPTEPGNTSSRMIEVWSYESGNRAGSFDGHLAYVGRNHLTGTITFNVTTTPAFENVASPPGAWKSTYQSTLPSILMEAGGIYTIQIDGQSSILTETSPGSGIYEPSTDGYIRVSVNDTVLFGFDGPVWHGNRNTNRNWNSVSIDSVGKFTDFNVYDEDSCVTEPPFCPCEPTPTNPPPKPPPTPPNPPPQEPTIGEQLACLGGGLVPIQADFPPQELWWGL